MLNRPGGGRTALSVIACMWLTGIYIVWFNENSGKLIYEKDLLIIIA